MITNKKDLLFYLNEDKKRNLGDIKLIKYIAEKIYRTDRYMAYNYLKALRKYEYAINVQTQTLLGKIVYIYRKLRWRHLTIKYNCMLPPNVIGYGFKMAHIVGGGIIINCKSIGCYCSANAGVVVGNKDSQDKIATIGNYVSLSVGCKVIGNVSIGNNVIVAPNSVVVKDIPDNCVVSGVPARIIKKDGIKI
jgi:serine O-acetyltransferase